MEDQTIVAGGIGALFLALIIIAFGLPYLAGSNAQTVNDAINQKIATAAVATGIGVPDISEVKDPEIKTEIEEALDAVEEEDFELAYKNAKEIEQLLIQKNMQEEHEIYKEIEKLAAEGKTNEARELAEQLVQKLS